MKRNRKSIRSLVEAEHSRRQVDRIVHAVGEDQTAFDELAEIFTGSDAELARRAAWAISYIAEANPELAKKWIGRFLRSIENPAKHPAIYRNTFRLLQEIPIPAKYQAAVFDHSIKHILNASQTSGIRAFAMSAAFNAASDYPELLAELQLVITESMKDPQPAIQSRGRKVLNSIQIKRM